MALRAHRSPARHRARTSAGTGTPGGAKKLRLTGDPSEDELHFSVAQLLDRVFAGRPVVWTTFPAGGYQLTRAAAVRLYRLGLKKGMPDIQIMWAGKIIGIELKARRGTRSAAQRHMHTQLTWAGVPVAVCRDTDDVILFLRKHAVPMLNVRLNSEVLYGHQGAANRGETQSQESPRLP
jgi:hypothetical protein